VKSHLLLFACLSAFFATGCAGEIVPVSGRVTENGKPLPDAVVTFQPRGDRKSREPAASGSVGRTDSQGRYRLRTVSPERAGALVGDHSVTIGAAEPKERSAKTARVPKSWRDGSKHFAVPSRGTTEANFDIGSP